MKIEIEWATSVAESHKTTLDWEQDLTPNMREEIERELGGMEDGGWPELGVRHDLPELETSDQLADSEDDASRQSSEVETRYTTGITFRDPTIQEAVSPGIASTRTKLEAAILYVKSNGYDVTKQPDPGGEYVDGLFEFAMNAPQRFVTTDHEQAKLGQLVNAVGLQAEHDAIEIYVEVDRSLLYDTIVKSGGDPTLVVGSGLWTYLWPVVIRVDEDGDIVLHATTGERVQFGQDDVTPAPMRTVK